MRSGSDPSYGAMGVARAVYTLCKHACPIRPTPSNLLSLWEDRPGVWCVCIDEKQVVIEEEFI